MFSQGNSSVRIYLGAAFAPMVGDPLSREVSTPSASSMESTLEVALCPADKKVTEPMLEMTSTSGRFNEEGEVAVSCEDL